MTNTIKLSSSTVVLMRRISSLVSVISSVACVLMLLFGFVPLYNQGASVVAVLSNVFAIFDIFTKSFWPCLCKIVFTLVYVIIAIRMIKDTISSIKSYRKWFVERHDLAYGRERATFCIKTFNMNLLYIICMLVFSSFASSYELSSGKNAVIIVLLIINFIVNAARLLYLKRNIVEALAAPAAVSLMMYSIVAFNFGVSRFEVYELFNSVGNLFKLLSSTEFMGFLINIVTTQILVPIFHLVTLISLIIICESACNYIFMNETVVKKSKAFAIRNFTFICIILVLKGFMNEYREFDKYIELVMGEMMYILVSAFVWVSSYSTVVSSLDAPTESDEEAVANATPATEQAVNMPTVTAEVSECANESIEIQTNDENNIDSSSAQCQTENINT